MAACWASLKLACFFFMYKMDIFRLERNMGCLSSKSSNQKLVVFQALMQIYEILFWFWVKELVVLSNTHNNRLYMQFMVLITLALCSLITINCMRPTRLC